MRVSMPLAAVVVGSLWLAGCGDDGAPAKPPEAWRTVAEKDLDAAQQAQRDRALAARKALFEDLFRTVSYVGRRGGPAGAIAVCKDRAPALAEATAKAHGVRIGRTSFRLRNPRNEAPGWVAPLTADRPDTPRYASGPRGEFGAVLPIKLQATCLPCHGPEDAIPEDVRRRLREAYPDDRATGFREGDLRGWFWVEVPGPS